MMRIFVLDLDESVATQSCLADRLRSGTAEHVPLQDLAPRLRILARRRTMREFVQRLPRPVAGRVPEVFFYGSGDFHHIAACLIDRSREPLTIIQIDNHPDWVQFPPTDNCGAWVNRALARPHVVRVVTLGPASDDLVWPELKTANLGAIAGGKLEVYPWRCEPSRVLGSHGPARCWRIEGGRIIWSTLEMMAWDVFLADLVASLPTEAVWLSIDKDVLGPAEAVTNWDQAGMPLAHILQAIEVLGVSKRIVGIDVCGDYSVRRFNDPFRAIVAHLDSPQAERPTQAMLEVNDRTNRRIIEVLERMFPAFQNA